MATKLTKIEINRVFVMKKGGKEIRLQDPDPQLPPAKVAVFYSNQYPELLNASVTGPKYEGDAMLYTMSASIGVKG